MSATDDVNNMLQNLGCKHGDCLSQTQSLSRLGFFFPFRFDCGGGDGGAGVEVVLVLDLECLLVIQGIEDGAVAIY